MASSVTPNTNNDTPLSNGTQTSLAIDDGNEEDPIKILGTNINAMFLVLMGTLIIFMQAGFGFLEAGSIRAKNTTNILIKNFADLTFGNFITLDFRRKIILLQLSCIHTFSCNTWYQKSKFNRRRIRVLVCWIWIGVWGRE